MCRFKLFTCIVIALIANSATGDCQDDFFNSKSSTRRGELNFLDENQDLSSKSNPQVSDSDSTLVSDTRSETFFQDPVSAPEMLSFEDSAKRASGSHKILFFKNDFSYLTDPAVGHSFLGDTLKLNPVADGRLGSVDVGGQFRWRYHHEKGMGQTAGLTRFQNNSNDFHLTRLRLYTDWQINQDIRVFWEGIYAGLDTNSTYVPRPIDENYGDFLNLFVDIKLSDTETIRVGRQELLYGAQRTVSPLDWANTRRTFEGVMWKHQCEHWTIDSFFTNFVPVNPTRFDRADYDQSFYGIYSVYKGIENFTLDWYYLGYDHQTVGTPIVSDFSLHTLGSRLNGSLGDWLIELENGQQFGRQSGLGLDHTGMFYTGGIGRKMGDMPGSPTVWLYYDYASGNNIGGNFNRFNHLFPLAHKYLGFIDAVQRSNIEAPNILVTAKPTKKTSLLVWYYHLMSNQDTDIVPAVGATPAPQSTTSKDLGDELDLIFTVNVSPRSKFLIGWSHFWIGNKIQTADRADADFFYSQWHLNF